LKLEVLENSSTSHGVISFNEEKEEEKERKKQYL
jgi:hypothetical protein